LPPAKFKTPRDKSAAALRRAALARLKSRWTLGKDDDREWEPESEPIVEPMLASVGGGVAFCVRALRAHNDDDARAFLEVYDALTRQDRRLLKVEEIAHAAGIGSLRLAEVTQTALFLYGDRQTQMILSAAMPKVIRATIKAATDQVPIVADIDGRRMVVGKTNGDMHAAEMLLKARNVVPVPKGSQINIQNNNSVTSERDQKPDGGHVWKYPEDRLKEIAAVTSPKRLEASTSRPGEMIHFEQNRPVVFER
jgi:hypothetical protein